MQNLTTHTEQKPVGLLASAAWDTIYVFFWSCLFIAGIINRLATLFTATRAPAVANDKMILVESLLPKD